jgi:cellobiose phosphorylase
MSNVSIAPAGFRLINDAGLTAELNANGSVRRLACHGVMLSLFPGNEIEGGPANLYLRVLEGEHVSATPLLGPSSPTRFQPRPVHGCAVGAGSWQGIDYSVSLVLARSEAAWFWHVQLLNTRQTAVRFDVTYAQDIALAPYGAVRLNEFYVSQYVDHTPLTHPERGIVVASRQNQAVDGRNPWSLIGSLRKASSCATDALQLHGLRTRAGQPPSALLADLPGTRLQHEHSMAVVRDAPAELAPGARVDAGFFGLYLPEHRDATSPSDLDHVSGAMSLPEAVPPRFEVSPGTDNPATLFSSAPLLQATDLDRASLRALFGTPWGHEELDDRGELLSFFHGSSRHVVLRAKELRVLRPHGHLLRTGRHVTPDESGLTSTAWMCGVFHSMLTQGHVSINRFLSTVHSYLGLFRSHGQRVFVEVDGRWQLLHIPSAFEMTPDACRWIYRHRGGEIHVRAATGNPPHELSLTLHVQAGAPTRFLISHHIALNGDDGSTQGPALWRREGNGIVLRPAPGSELAQRFPQGSFILTPIAGTEFSQVGGDELLFEDGRSRQQPFLCIVTNRAASAGLRIRGGLVAEETQNPLQATDVDQLIPDLPMSADILGAMGRQLLALCDIVPWYTHNALVHYLSPRGLEQYSGGGWGTRDVCQGPVEMLLALGRPEPVRDLLLRVMRQQNPDGDWPQWFMFFERERNIRPGDSHGDIVFWPVLVLAQYLIATGDESVLDERVRFFDGQGPDEGEEATVRQHVERALALIRKRVIPGTSLAAYGHGDWNDSLQPADPVMRERMCSAWTVTLHYQTLTTLAQALRGIGRTGEAASLEGEANAVLQDFQRLLIVGGELAGYALFEADGRIRYLLHPKDDTTGVKHSSLAMIHAILEDLFTPEQAREHLRLIETHLSGPDGVRLFDRPLPYHGGPQRFFQRAESATFFGREIGLMYTHAHLRYAQALAHIGESERFFRALCQANPIEIRSIVPAATLRQANCYYSSSDAAFADRYEASAEYRRIASGEVALEGGWRVYSSGAGIALGLIVRRFLGVSVEARTLSIDPVIPHALDGLRAQMNLLDQRVELQYQVGPRGCGVEALELNGTPLAFTRGPNPHRPGAALVPMATAREGIRSGTNVLRIVLG